MVGGGTMKKFVIQAVLGMILAAHSFGQQPTWIWYPGDYEIWLHREMSLRRNEWGGILPPPWRLDSHFGLVSFYREVDLAREEKIRIRATTEYAVRLDRRVLPDTTTVFTVPEGKHLIEIYAWDYDVLPAIFLQGETIISDTSWRVRQHYEASLPVGTPERSGMGAFMDLEDSPLTFNFRYTLQRPVRLNRNGNNLLADFGRETFGFVQLLNISQPGKVTLYYGETEEEAMDDYHCQTYEILDIPGDSLERYTIPITKGLRYCRAVPRERMAIGDMQLLYEYLPLEYTGSFTSSDTLLNRIYDVSAYTLHLTSREFFLDGVKRDRWVWTGDAVQSELMNFYLFFDKDIVKRTLWALRGKDPVETHINRIMDYSYYWFIGVYDYFHHTGDTAFVRSIYPRMLSLMEYCTDRINPDGFVDENGNGWLFLDWAPIEKTGELAAFQILLARSLEAMGACAGVAGDGANANKYKSWSGELKQNIYSTFWDEGRQVLVHNRKDGRLSEEVTRYAAIFSLLFDYINDGRRDILINNTLKNDSVPRITTPYMRFYELAALCEAGEHDYVLEEILDYWGGMLALGATTFWEQYLPDEQGTEHYAMYGRPYRRSLCHSWGASPIYLVGKYFLGVEPASTGYETFRVKPDLGGLAWMKGTVPVNLGTVELYMDAGQVKVSTTRPGGTLVVSSRRTPKTNMGRFTRTGEHTYELELEVTGTTYIVDYHP